jgi:peptide/nickel transport system substrate-binding protein
MGQKLAAATAEYKPVDARTFRIVLKQKFGPVLEALGKPSVVVPFIFPRKAAEAQDAFTQSDNVIGSGPFMFKKDEWKPGEKVVYVRIPSTSRGPSRCRASPAARWSSWTASNGSGSSIPTPS